MAAPDITQPLKAVPFEDNRKFASVRTADGFFTICVCYAPHAHLFAASVALLAACQAADADFEISGAITEETVLKLRAALDQVKGAA